MCFPPECKHGPAAGAGDSCEHQGEIPGEGSWVVGKRKRYFIPAAKALLYFGFS